MLVNDKIYIIMKKINLKACGLTEMDSNSLVAIDGGCLPGASWRCFASAIWDDFFSGFSAGFHKGLYDYQIKQVLIL
jgi:hypothetical protein